MKKISIVLSMFFFVGIILLTILLTQNQNDKQNPLSGLTSEETAVRYAKGMTVAGYHIDPITVEAIQQVEINDMVLVLVQYSGHRVEGDAELCEMILEVKKKLLNQWEVKGGAGLCHEIADLSTNIPITVVSNYGISTLLDRGYSTVFGYLRNEQITKVVVTWEDGLEQPASVSERTYLATREGGYHVEKIETYNDLGEIIFETHYPKTVESNP